jgi:histidine ammonia-lyase
MQLMVSFQSLTAQRDILAAHIHQATPEVIKADKAARIREELTKNSITGNR